MATKDVAILAYELEGTDDDIAPAASRLGIPLATRTIRRRLARQEHIWQCPNCAIWTREDRCRRCCHSVGSTHCPSGLIDSDSFCFNYHTIRHLGEHLPSIYAIPRPWPDHKDTKAEAKLAEETDLDCYYAINRWFRYGDRDAFRRFVIYSVRWLPTVADSVYKLSPDADTYPRDWGDAIWICVGAAFDAIHALREYNPVEWHDDEELHPEGKKYRKHRGKYWCEPYVRFIRDAAQRAMDIAQRDYNREIKRRERCFCSRYSTNRGVEEPYVTPHLTSVVEEEAYSDELFEMSHREEDATIHQPSWLTRLEWINRRIPGDSDRDKFVRAVLEAKMEHPEFRQDEIADVVASKTRVRRHPTTIGRILNKYLEAFENDFGLKSGRCLKGTAGAKSALHAG